MAEDLDSTGKLRRLRQFLSLVILGVALFIAWQLQGRKNPATRDPAGSEAEARQLFEQASWSPGRATVDRMKAAGKLGALRAGETYAVLILEDPESLGGPPDEPASPEERRRQEEERTAVVASVLANIPPAAGNAVFCAVTHRLADLRVGRYTEEEGKPPNAKKGERTTPALRDLAHEALQGTFGTDHGYDGAAWRKQIVESRRAAEKEGAK